MQLLNLHVQVYIDKQSIGKQTKGINTRVGTFPGEWHHASIYCTITEFSTVDA